MRASYEETCGLVSEPTTTLSAHKDIRTSWPPLHPSQCLFLSHTLSLWCSLCDFEASHSHRCKDATRSAVHESGATPSLTTARHLL
ncbi:MAG: hypothetical protein ACK55Z_06150, partial [bacterium]